MKKLDVLLLAIFKSTSSVEIYLLPDGSVNINGHNLHLEKVKSESTLIAWLMTWRMVRNIPRREMSISVITVASVSAA